MKSVKKRIALWFVALSTLVYVTPTLLGAWFFYNSHTEALDLELKSVAASLGHVIEIVDAKPHFRDWSRVVQTDPPHSVCSIQLYAADGTLLEHNVATAIYRIARKQKEISDGQKTMRVWCGPISTNGEIIGFQQIEVSTIQRDVAMRQFVLMMAVIAPIIVLGLGACSYYVAQKATVPIHQTVDMLRQFMADAGHELTTPLSIIEASAETIEQKLRSQNLTATEPTTIINSADRMQNIIDNLMMLAQLDAPQEAQPIRESLSVRNLIENCTESFKVKYDQRGVGFRVGTVDDAVIQGDKEQLHAALSNLIENALRYTPGGGLVQINAQKSAHAIRIVIKDNGIGIPTESLPRIFDRFYRVDESRSRSSGGSGLGLAIVKAVIEAHQGKLDVGSKVGEGTEFTITLAV